MSDISIPKTGMREILSGLMVEKRVAAPAFHGKVVDFIEVSDTREILMDDDIAYKSPKEFLFPRCEELFSFKDGQAILPEAEKDLVIFGAKPCDLAALKVLDTIFTGGKFSDPFYNARRENALLIGVGCVSKKPGCFCDRLEVDMSASQDCDLFLTDEGESYKVLFASDRGKAVLGQYIPGLGDFQNPDPKQPEPENPLSISDNELEMFDKIDWERISETCQSCGLCTFVCPTCHCFDFKDVETDNEASRYRNWDSCMFPRFTLHASGHNPRRTKMERYRQRVLHKYLYVKKNFDLLACTGCGRCVRSCPAGVNIETVVEGIMEDLA